MKQTKKILLLSFSLLLIFLTGSCEKDDSHSHQHFGKRNSVVKEVSLEKLLNNRKFNQVFSKISQKQVSSAQEARSSIIEQYDFTIDNYPAKVIELDSLTSYTFSINNATRTDSVFENLVINHYTDGSVKAAIFKFFPESDNVLNSIIIEEHNSKGFVGTIQVTDIDYESSILVQRQSTVCVTFRGLLCDYEYTHPAGERCSTTYWGSFTTCDTTFEFPDFILCPVQIIEDTNNPGGGTFPASGYLNYFINSLTTEQLDIYYSNPSIEQYLISNLIVAPNPNYNPLIGGDPTVVIIEPNAESFVNELIDLARLDVTQNTNAISFVLQAKQQDKMSSELDDAFLQSVNQYLAIDTSNIDPIVMAQLRTYFTVKCAVLRHNHPDWSDLRIYYKASVGIANIVLDAFGMVPVVGEIADLTNGVLYLIEGDGVNATLSFASSVPIAGWVSVTTKYAFKINEVAVIATKVKLVWKVTASGLIEFGSRSQLRKVLGLLPGNPNQAHHLIPWEGVRIL